MTDDRDLRLVLLALRDGLIDPARLAAAAAGWPAHPPTSLTEFLIAAGILTTELRHQLERAADKPTASVAERPRQADIVTDLREPRPAMLTADLPPIGIAAVDDNPPTLGDRYRVESLHRTGGLGRVWVARDNALGRDVALKDLRPERSVDSGLRERFVEEARITGQLEHPCIVPVYDLISGAEGPCYTMRFVAGRTLAEAARAYHDARIAGRTDPLALAALLDAFVAVCRAVAYAHNRGILHRDLKGQNIVLGEYGEVFVLDWGLAKLSGDPMTVDGPAVITPHPYGPREETISGAVLGTPAFMAPELVDGRAASRASDVYGLGGVLYVILTGRPPYDGPNVPSVIEQLLSGPPPAPKALNPGCPPALDAVCRTAMARDPVARYLSAEAVAADVRRWLADEPVSVYRERWSARLVRWGRRHRAAVLGVAAVLLTALIGLTVSTALVWREERRTAGERDRAEQNLTLAHGLAFNLLDIAEKKVPNIPQAEDARKDMTDAAVATFRQALAQRPDDSDLREKTARANRFAANFHRMLNHNAIAERSYGESIRILEALVADKPNEAVFRDRLAEALRDQAQVIAKLGRLGDAVATGRRAAELAEELRAADPDNPDYRRTLATGLIDLSGYEYIRGKFAASEESAGRAADLFAALVDTPPGEPRPLDALLLAMALHRRAIALGELKQSDRSLKASTDALARLRKLPATSNDVQHFRARILVEQAKVSIGKPPRHAAAETDLGRAIRRWDDLQERYPQIVMYREWQSAAYEIRARLLLALGRPDPAADDLEKSRALLEKLVSEFPDVPSYRSLLGRTYLTFGRVEAARRNTPAAVGWLAKALAACRAALALSPESGLEQRTLGEVQAELKQAAPAGR